jgi:hypothetical protein
LSNKITNFLRKIPDTYYNYRKRGEKIDKLLSDYSENVSILKKVIGNLESIENRVGKIEKQMISMLSHLDTVKHGTRMELFETLHNYRQLLVVKRGWATSEEKKEVEEIYNIYSKELNGNGSGDRYYHEIIALPESEEEKEMKNNV